MTDKVSNVLVTDVSFRCNPGLENLETGIQANETFKKLTTLCWEFRSTILYKEMHCLMGKGSVSHGDCGAYAQVCQPQDGHNSVMQPADTLCLWPAPSFPWPSGQQMVPQLIADVAFEYRYKTQGSPRFFFSFSLPSGLSRGWMDRVVLDRRDNERASWIQC